MHLRRIRVKFSNRHVFDFSVRKGLAGLTTFTAPAVKTVLNIKIMDDDTTRYLKKTVWSTVEYR